MKPIINVKNFNYFILIVNFFIINKASRVSNKLKRVNWTNNLRKFIKTISLELIKRKLRSLQSTNIATGKFESTDRKNA